MKTGGRRNRATQSKINGIVEYPGSIEQFKRDLISKAETLKLEIKAAAKKYLALRKKQQAADEYLKAKREKAEGDGSG